MGPEPDYSREALARFIDFVVEKGLVNPSTAQGWRVATSKVLEDIPSEARTDVRRIDVETVFRAFLHRNPGRLSPVSVGEYRRRVGRAIEEFVKWVEDPGGYGARSAGWQARADGRPRVRSSPAPRDRGPAPEPAAGGIALNYPLRPGFLAQVTVPRDLTVEEARRMGAFLLTLAPDFKPGPG
ncbi:MAG TPA: hypothetical protein VMN37_12090 [Gemmatimonadales bacterium]|nr:hypothetical protein [Gemmatimonadales bacterium]